jgi:hypothetical protein
LQTEGGPPCPAPRLGGLAAGAATRLGTGYAVETMGAASDPSARGVWHVHVFSVCPQPRGSSALPFPMTTPKILSQRMKLPIYPCKDLYGLLQCPYGQIYDVVIAMDHLENTQRPP